MSADSGGVGAAVRAAAARRVAAVAVGRRSLSALPPDDVTARDRGLLQALTIGTLRWHHRLQWQLDRLLTKPLGAAEAELAALLRVGLFQVQWLRVPEHAAVASTVGAAALIGRRHARGLVNAVLRRFLRDRKSLDARLAESPVAAFSHPEWLIALIEADWPDAATEIFAANNTAAPMWLRVNQRRGSLHDYRQELAAVGMETRVCADLPTALCLGQPLATADLPGYFDGRVSVQDGAAQFAAPLLRLGPGQRVLDACAAPGGKTAHILEICADLEQLVALDRDRQRLDTVADNLRRLGLTGDLIHADAGDVSSWWDGRPFDRILLDAPCSATGVIRRHPDIKLLRQATDVAQTTALQSQLLQSLWPLLKPGGRLVYATCSVLKIENVRQIERFVADVADAEISAVGMPGMGQRLPGEADMDGFYYACIDRRVGR